MLPELTYIKDMYTQNTGGGFMCDVIQLDDGSVLVISEEAIVLYPTVEAWETSESDGMANTMLRPT
jgi:hypothetical protein